MHEGVIAQLRVFEVQKVQEVVEEAVLVVRRSSPLSLQIQLVPIGVQDAGLLESLRVHSPPLAAFFSNSAHRAL